MHGKFTYRKKKRQRMKNEKSNHIPRLYMTLILTLLVSLGLYAQREDDLYSVLPTVIDEKQLAAEMGSSGTARNPNDTLLYMPADCPGYELMTKIQSNLGSDSCIYYLEEFRQIATRENIPVLKIYYYRLLASIYFRMHEFSKAAEAGRTQAALAKKYNNMMQLYNAYERVAMSMSFEGKPQEVATAYEMLERNAKEMQMRAENEELQQMRLAKRRNANSQYVLVLFFLMIMVLLAAIIYTTVSRNRNLQLVSDMKTTFVQNMSHEIRTPLNAIVGFSQLLTLPSGVLSEEEKENYGEYIRTNSDMLTMLIDDILNLSDVESGNYHVHLAPANVNAPAIAAMKTAELRVPEGVNMYYTTEVDDDFSTMTDVHRVQQVLINYITNACKHTKEGEIHIHCSLSERAGYVTYSVTDTGVGVPADKAEEIFQRFTKLDAFAQGTGLGLSICRMIAAKLNGVVKLDTSYTKGARFIFQIPAN